MLLDLRADLRPNARVVEFYAGIGVIGFCVLDKAASVICGEINPFAEVAFRKSLELYSDFDQGRSIQSNQNISFITGAAVDQIALLKQADVAIVDPPRKGLDKALLKALLCTAQVKELWYISCGWAGFKRDCEELQKGWKLKKAKAYLFFPGTNQLEVLAKFEKTG
jgi:23S rRNA (uracil1939-C5)-methyltransferase